MGYVHIGDPGGNSLEADTATCCHCNAVWVLRASDPAKGNLGGWCRNCMDAVCPRCAGLDCTPFLKRIERYEARNRFLSDVEAG